MSLQSSRLDILVNSQAILHQPQFGLANCQIFLQNHAHLSSIASLGAKTQKWGTDLKPDEQNKKTVLIVDDEPTILTSISLMLEINGCTTSKCESGVKALEIIDSIKDNLDCIILDYSMPVLNGIEVLTKLRGQGIDIPVIMCTGMPLDRADGQTVWPDEILAKPFQLPTLLEKIDKVCQR